jgi:hypothetical protein
LRKFSLPYLSHILFKKCTSKKDQILVAARYIMVFVLSILINSGLAFAQSLSGAGSEIEQKTSNPAPQPPKPAIKRPTIWGEPTEVEILLFVLDIDAVNSAEQSFSASVYLEARWNSSFLAHKGTGPIVRGLSDIWSPRLAIVNQCLPSALMGQIEVIA